MPFGIFFTSKADDHANNASILQEWDGPATSTTVDTTNKRTGTASYALGANCTKNLPSNMPEFWVAFAVRFGPGLVATTVVSFQDNTTEQVGLRFFADGHIELLRGATILGASGPSIVNVAGAWTHIEIGVIFHASAGTFTCRVNEVVALSGSGANTITTANAYISRVQFAKASGDTNIDDVIFSTGGLVGDLRVLTRRMNGAGFYSGFTASPAVANYLDVDDASPDGDTTHVSSAATGAKDSYAHEPLAVAGDIIAVEVHHIAGTDTGTRAARSFLRIAGTDYNGTPETVNVGYFARARHVWELNPATAAAWTEAAFDAAEPGIEITT